MNSSDPSNQPSGELAGAKLQPGASGAESTHSQAESGAPISQSAGVVGQAGGGSGATAGGAAVRAVNYPAFFGALGNALRWEMVKLIASRGPMTASMMSKAVGREFDGVSKHLRLMCRARVLRVRPGEDRRQGFYQLPDGVLRADGVLDYGFCVVRL